jgi:hypothetical protein
MLPVASTPMISTLETGLIAAGSATFVLLLVFVIVFYYLYKNKVFLKSTIDPITDAAELRHLPIHKALVEHAAVDVVLKVIEENKGSVHALIRDYSAFDVAIEIRYDVRVLRALLLLSLPVDPISKAFVDPAEHRYAWTKIIQEDEHTSLVEEVIEMFPHLFMELSQVRDQRGRTSIKIASPRNESLLKEVRTNSLVFIKFSYL